MTLLHHFLIAMPTLQDQFFKKTVIYLCEHTAQGAMGIVINQPLSLTAEELLSQLKIKTKTRGLIQPIFKGGPIANDHGFILHSPQSGFSSSTLLSEEIMLTNSSDILETLGTDTQPTNMLIALGYASWQQGQLEQELVDNSWLIVHADPNIIYHTPINERWQKSIECLGIKNAWQIVTPVGCTQ